mmetsp:Transcript_28996/g.83796  ORF Transcript_28996/g.83796 Transcript_28996/m.83796 type:complete len:258 (+) Transcript_28996:189-962(+)
MSWEGEQADRQTDRRAGAQRPTKQANQQCSMGSGEGREKSCLRAVYAAIDVCAHTDTNHDEHLIQLSTLRHKIDVFTHAPPHTPSRRRPAERPHSRQSRNDLRRLEVALLLINSVAVVMCRHHRQLHRLLGVLLRLLPTLPVVLVLLSLPPCVDELEDAHPQEHQTEAHRSRGGHWVQLKVEGRRQQGVKQQRPRQLPQNGERECGREGYVGRADDPDRDDAHPNSPSQPLPSVADRLRRLRHIRHHARAEARDGER